MPEEKLTYELVEDATRVFAGDELVLRFYDDPPWLQLAIFRTSAEEFALELIGQLQKRQLDVGEEGYQLNLLILSAQGFEWTDEDGDERVGAIVRARVNDLRPPDEQVQEASFATGLKIATVLAFALLALFLIKPVLVETRRVVRGFSDEEQAEQAKGPKLGTVALAGILIGGAVLLLYLWQRGKGIR